MKRGCGFGVSVARPFSVPLMICGVALVPLLVGACGSERLGASPAPEPQVPGADEGFALSVQVPETGRLLLDLATPKRIEAPDQGRMSLAWDLAIEGYEVFTNGGVSGPGSGSAFGRFSRPTFLSDTAPNAPFLLTDEPGGAFYGWYAYDGVDHDVLSRYHVYGVRDGSRIWKVQVLDYYNRALATAVPAIFTLRYAELSAEGISETLELSGIDATDGSDGTEAVAACVALDTQELFALTAAEASASNAWHLCFRRDRIRVNGGFSGPRGLVAVDLNRAESETETLAELAARTPNSELSRFEEVDFGKLSDAELSWRSDGIVTAFTDRWLVPGADPPAPMQGVWLVVGADGASNYLLEFEKFDGATRATPKQVNLRVKAVR